MLLRLTSWFKGLTLIFIIEHFPQPDIWNFLLKYEWKGSFLSLLLPVPGTRHWMMYSQVGESSESISSSKSLFVIMNSMYNYCTTLLHPYLVFKKWTMKMYCIAWYWRHVYCFIIIQIEKCDLLLMGHPKMSATKPTVKSKII